MKELAIKMAWDEQPGLPLHELMSSANEIFKGLNSGRYEPLPFTEQDIVQAEFAEFVKKNCSDREKNLIIVQELLTRCWNTWHIGVQTLNEPVSPVEAQETRLLHPALTYLGLNQLLERGLRRKTLNTLKALLACNPRAE